MTMKSRPGVACLVGLLMIATIVVGAEDQGARNARQLLESGNFEALERHFGQAQEEYREGRITESEIRDAFRAFYMTDDGLDPQYVAWIKAYPSSYAAHLARAIYYKKRVEARLDGYVFQITGVRDNRAIRQELENAMADLDASFELDAKPVLSFGHAIDVAVYLRPPSVVREFLDRGLELDSRSMLLRSKYLSSLEPRFGGSLAEMTAFFNECAGANLSEKETDALKDVIDNARKWKAKYDAANPRIALREFLIGVELSKGARCDACAALLKDADGRMEAGNFYKAIELYSAVIERKGDLMRAYRERAHALMLVNRRAESFVDVRIAAKGGDPAAQHALAALHWAQVIDLPDRRVAMENWASAAAAGLEVSEQTLALRTLEEARRKAQ